MQLISNAWCFLSFHNCQASSALAVFNPCAMGIVLWFNIFQVHIVPGCCLQGSLSAVMMALIDAEELKTCMYYM